MRTETRSLEDRSLESESGSGVVDAGTRTAGVGECFRLCLKTAECLV